MCKHQMSGWCFYSAKFLMLTSLAILQDTSWVTRQWLNFTKIYCKIFHSIHISYTKWAKLWLRVQVELLLTKRNRIADEVDFCKCKFHPTCELSREPLLTCLLLLHWIWILRESRTKEGNFCKYIEWICVFFLNCSWLQWYCMMFDV